MARASTLGFAMAVNMLIPFVFDDFQICLDQLADLLQLPASESMGLSEQERLYPKFSVFLRAFNVNMHRLLSFPTEEEKPVSEMAENFGHRGQKSAEGMAARRGKSGLVVQFWLRPIWSPRRPIYAALRYQLVALATYLPKGYLVAAATYLRFAPVHQALVSASLGIS